MALGVLLVGYGVRGRAWASEIVAEGWQIAGVVDPSASALASARDLGLAPETLFADTHSGLERTDCDVVLIASDPRDHFSSAVAAIEAGRAVVVEKPFTASLQEAAEVVRRAEASDVPVVVAQNYRYMRAHRAARRVIESGSIGEVHRVIAHYHRPPHQMTPSLAASEHSVLWGMGVHHLDALRYVLSAEAVDLVAESSTAPTGSGPSHPTVRIMANFERGIRVDYSATYESSGHGFFEGGQEFYERIVGHEATLHIFHRWLFLSKGRKLIPIRRGKRSLSEERQILRDAAKWIETGEPAETSGRDNLQTMALLEAAVVSSRQRRWIDVRELIDA